MALQLFPDAEKEAAAPAPTEVAAASGSAASQANEAQQQKKQEEDLFWASGVEKPTRSNLEGVSKIRNGKSAQRVSFGAGYPRRYPGRYPGGRPGAKTSVKPSKSWKKNKHFGADVHDPKARKSMTPGGFKKTSVRKTSG